MVNKRINKKMKVLIYGTGQIGNMVDYILSLDNRKEVIGFIDDDPQTHGTEFRDKKVFGGYSVIPELMENGAQGIIVAIGQVESRRDVARRVKKLEINQVNAIHPTAIISEDVQIGSGNIIGAGSILYVNPKIGSHVFIGPGVTISHDSTVEDYALLSVGSVIGARVDVKEGAFVGAGATAMPPGWGEERLCIGEDSTIGVGAVVIGDVKPNSIVAGVPAKLLRYKNNK